MKTNSKLFRGVLLCALIACFLCSVFVAGNGAGAANVKAADVSYTAQLYYNSANWAISTNGNATANITGDGTYTITTTNASGYGDSGIAQVMYIDVVGAAGSGIVISNVSVKAADATVAVDNSKIACYDNEGNYRVELYNQWGATGSNPAVDPAFTERIEVEETLSITFTVDGLDSDESTSPSDTEESTSPSDTEETPSTSESTTASTESSTEATTTTTTVAVDIDFDAINSKEYNMSGTVNYGEQNDPNLGCTWLSFTRDLAFTGFEKAHTIEVTFESLNPDPSWQSAAIGQHNIYWNIPGLGAELKAQGVTDSNLVEDVKFYLDDADIANNAKAFIKEDGSVEVAISNPWNAEVGVNNTSWSKSLKLVMTLSVAASDSGAGDPIVPDTPDEEPEEDKEEEQTQGIVPNDNGYYHDRGAIFIYTGTKYDIRDFVFYGGVCLEEQAQDGTWYKWSNDWSELAGKGIYIKYWDDYKGIGYPAIQLSWRTELTYMLSLSLRSQDWTYNDYTTYSSFFDRGNNIDGSNRWYFFGEGSYEAAEDTTTEDTATQNPVPTTEGAVNVTGDGEYYSFLAIGADNNSGDWHYSWAGVQKAEEEDDNNKMPPAGLTVEAVNAKIGEQFTISLKTETPVAYTWYVAPTIIVGADKTAVDAEVVAVRIDGKDVTDTINFVADEKTWWYEDTGIYNKANNDNKDVAARLAGGYNEWGTKYIAEAPAGYTSIEYDIIINSIA